MNALVNDYKSINELLICKKFISGSERNHKSVLLFNYSVVKSARVKIAFPRVCIKLCYFLFYNTGTVKIVIVHEKSVVYFATFFRNYFD